MPVYEFQCNRCGHEFEDLVSLRDLEEGKVECPNCGSKDVRRKLSLFATRSTGGSARESSSCGPSG
ncbi:MAG: FmdB family zinc ribbon protein [Candidatus Fervidibacter sp.]|uniref:FmdB family zinc ribbon protein n=1 Tax=Candidatus Fervidibacter sp. TaxID=3100871 RepID=UPI004049CA61